MCELLVRVVDKINNEDKYLDAKLLKRGDVVCIVEDNHDWSEAERTSPEWRILKFPKLSVDDMQSFIMPQPEKDPTNPSRLLQRRAIKIDLDNPLFGIQPRFTQLTRVVDTTLGDVSLKEISALKEIKPYLIDDDIFSLEQI